MHKTCCVSKVLARQGTRPDTLSSGTEWHHCTLCEAFTEQSQSLLPSHPNSQLQLPPYSAMRHGFTSAEPTQIKHVLPLQTHGYSPQGPLIKSESGELSNMRYDLAPSQMKDYYGKSNRKVRCS